MTETTLQTACGPIRGILHDGVRTFRGITYAGCTRFGHPEILDAWDGTYDATAFGTVCPQRSCRLASVIGEEKGSVIDENRLCLTVSTPEGARGLPVMVWVHGGAYLTGGSEEKRYSVERLARSGNVVVVKISYRLGAFGYLWDPGRGIGNLGLEDQQTALRWIHGHIADFGGNPDDITVFGQSAGAHAIACMIASCDGKTLFRRAVLQSPPLGISLSRKRAEKTTRRLMARLGKDLEQASMDEILDAQGKVSSVTSLAFMPVLDDAMAIPDGLADSGLEVICTWTAQDASPFLKDALGPLLGTSIGKAAIRFATRSVFEKPVKEYVGRLRNAGIRAGARFISWAPEGSPLGSCHCIELPFILGFYEDWCESAMFKGTSRETYVEKSREYLGAWTSFANGKGFPELDGNGIGE